MQKFIICVIGTVGLLLNSKKNNLIPSLKEAFIKLEEAGFYIHKNIIKKLLDEVNEN